VAVPAGTGPHINAEKPEWGYATIVPDLFSRMKDKEKHQLVN
jgi:hypothetical protein